MKTKVLFIALLIASAMAFTSCASSKSAGGCKAHQGFVGYR